MCVCRDVSPTTRIRAELRTKIGHAVWTKYHVASKDIHLQGLFNDYWNPENDNLTVLGWSSSPPAPVSSDRERQSLLSLENMVAL